MRVNLWQWSYFVLFFRNTWAEKYHYFLALLPGLQRRKKKRAAVSPLPWWRRHLFSVILYHWCSERCLHSQKSPRFLFVVPCLVVEAWSIFGFRLRRCIYLLNYHVCYMAWGYVQVIMHAAQSQSLGDYRHESQVCTTASTRDMFKYNLWRQWWIVCVFAGYKCWLRYEDAAWHELCVLRVWHSWHLTLWPWELQAHV